MASAQSELKAFVDGQLEVRACDDDSRVYRLVANVCILRAVSSFVYLNGPSVSLNTPRHRDLDKVRGSLNTCSGSSTIFGLLARSAACAGRNGTLVSACTFQQNLSNTFLSSHLCREPGVAPALLRQRPWINWLNLRRFTDPCAFRSDPPRVAEPAADRGCRGAPRRQLSARSEKRPGNEPSARPGSRPSGSTHRNLSSGRRKYCNRRDADPSRLKHCPYW